MTDESSEQSLSSILSETYDAMQEAPATPETPETPVEETETPVAETAEAEVEATASEPEKVEEPAKASPPDTWRAAAKAKWDALDPEIQQEVLKREEDASKGFAEYSEDRKFAQSLRDVINPYMPIINADGGTAETAVQSLLNTAYRLRTGTPEQKVQMLQQIARDYGIDMNQMPQGDDSYVDPMLAETRNELNQFKSQLQMERQAQVTKEIEAFKADHEHFDALSPTMTNLLKSGQAKDLNDAYEQAQWIVPTVRDAILAKQEQEKEAKRIAEQKAAAAAAKKAAGTQLTSKADVKGGSKPASLRESLEKKFEQIQAA